jgi:RND family efflux transporter MFP subunit
MRIDTTMSMHMRGIENRKLLRTLAATSLAVLLAACAPAGGEEATESTEVSNAADAAGGARIINVEVTPIELTEFVAYVRVTGEVEAIHDVTIAAEESGAITRFYVDKGAHLRLGDPIMKIDDEVLLANAEEARTLMEIASELYERQRQLWEDEGMGSEMAYLQAKASAGVARARFRTLETRLARTVVRAPVNGVFDEHFLDIGEMASPGTPVARVVSVDRVKIVGGVPERYALSVQRGDSARVELDAFPGREFLGTINFVGASVDPRARTVPIEIMLNNPDRALKPRMVANVEAELERFRDVVVVSQDLVVRTESGYQVFLVEEVDGESVARARNVQLGRSYGNQVVVVAGLSEGDPLITLGHRLVDDLSRIKIVNTGGTQ